MTQTYSVPAPAKINLFLHIIGRRSDGYHLLQTVFQILDFGDWLHFTPRLDENIQILPQLDGVPNETNLIYRAAMQLKPFATLYTGMDIKLDKNLPMGGGLGGGSSDAATTLLALNKLWQCQRSEEELVAIGLQLGADVPVFVKGKTAWAEGVGEQLTPIVTAYSWYLVVTPNCSVNTAKIFQHRRLTRDTSPIKIRALSTEGLKNDCQKVVCELYPEVQKALDWLNQFSTSMMTGTGASVFAQFDSKAAAQQALDQLPADWTGFIAQGVNSSPTLDVIASIATQ